MPRKAQVTTIESPDEATVQPGMQALQRGLHILELVASRDGPVRFTTLLEASALPKGTLHRILQTLIDERYLSLDDRSQSYALGSKPFQLAHRVWDQFDLRGAAEPELERLADLTGEAVRLGIVDGDKVLYIDQRDTPRQVRLANGTGARSAIHATALGKAMAAHMTEAERQRLLKDVDLESFTDKTIVEAGDLGQQLNIVKARGYAISNGEQYDDVSAVAAAILDHRARPLAAIGIVGPSYRLPTETLHSYGREVIEAARRISGNIGELAMSIAINPRPLDIGRDDIACAIPGEDFLGEGPFWDADAQRLHWVDILAPGLLSGDPATGERSFRPMPELVGVAIPKASGGFVCATETGIKTISATGEIAVLAEPEADRPGNRFNDGKCDSRGRLWVGSLAINTEPGRGRLWRVDPDGSFALMEEGLHISNGLGWSPDERTFYFTDGPKTIWAYDFDAAAGTISNKRAFAEFGPGDGVPDGLTVDAEGYVWVAIWDGWAVRRYAPDGRLDRTISLPVPRPTSCTFGGPDMDRLFVTSARIRLSAKHLAEAPLSGSVFALDAGVTGQKDKIFAG
ncbi:SMP-30/gluconolactonase/LRE family protein [Psychromarinibacter halotolerans]|uniref:SMP-30/gluconolactonase/LRE family protein n=1 Tax=Psychromarinibacter halotolerans TaxID=1775175 RepID=A0ABV7GS83_9RHOB|nr:SMP-30/gluconolactonase/LRE family protein [Psychromarinibacter halotolerans]MDF0597732.1 SMP-30/gluconolactonase/LRE family protein [Psychromarinibacter halotolerans]